MDHLVIMLVVVVGGALLVALLAGASDRRAATRIARQRERRDPIATGTIKAGDIDKALRRENRRRRREGRQPLERHEFESLVVADPRTRRRLLFRKGRR
jgi:hypothetical protein